MGFVFLQGPPDDFEEVCFPGSHSWIANGRRTLCDNCYLELAFRRPALPARLVVWSTYARYGGLRNLQLRYADGSAESLGPQPVFCDVPLTVPLAHVGRPVAAVRLFPAHQDFSLDAVQLVSRAGWQDCQACDLPGYRVLRDPPYPDGTPHRVTQSTVFTDT